MSSLTTANNDDNNNNNNDSLPTTIQAMEQAVAQLLASSFDADSKTCLLTLLKVLDNVLFKPGDERVRTIRLSNAAFSKKSGQSSGRNRIFASLWVCTDDGTTALVVVGRGNRIERRRNLGATTGARISIASLGGTTFATTTCRGRFEYKARGIARVTRSSSPTTTSCGRK